MSVPRTKKKNNTSEMPTKDDLAAAQKALPPGLVDQMASDSQAIQPTGGPQELGKVGEFKARAADFDTLMVHHGENEMGLVSGGNGARYPKIIPKDCLYVDSNQDPHEYAPILLHEGIESHLMQQAKWPYNRAHKVANHYEEIMRKQLLGQESQQQPQQALPPQALPQQGQQPGLSPMPGLPPMIGGMG